VSDEIISRIIPFINIAEKEGADEVDLFAISRKEKSVNIDSNVLSSAVSGYQQGVGIRVLVEKSVGYVAVNSFDENRVIDGIRSAIAIANVTPKQDHHYLPKPKKTRLVSSLFDEEVSSLSMESIISLADDFQKTIRNIDSRLTIWMASLVSRLENRAIASSTGMEVEERYTSISWGLFGWAVEGDNIGSMVGDYDSVVSMKDLNHIERSASFAQNALRCLNTKKTDSFKGDAIFSPEAMHDLFEIITVAALGTSIQAGNSYLQDKIGEEIAVKGLSISDDGTIPNRVSSGSFDREGTPHEHLRIIDAGIFKGIMHNSFTANKAGLGSTGHASGGYRQSPNTFSTNLEVGAGNKILDDMLSEVDHGIYIQRVSASPDYTSGDFSAVVKGGQLIEKGEITTALKEITVSGNIFESIKNISAISKERKFFRNPGGTRITYYGDSWLIPYIRIDNLDFAS